MAGQIWGEVLLTPQRETSVMTSRGETLDIEGRIGQGFVGRKFYGGKVWECTVCSFRVLYIFFQGEKGVAVYLTCEGEEGAAAKVYR